MANLELQSSMSQVMMSMGRVHTFVKTKKIISAHLFYIVDVLQHEVPREVLCSDASPIRSGKQNYMPPALGFENAHCRIQGLFLHLIVTLLDSKC